MPRRVGLIYEQQCSSAACMGQSVWARPEIQLRHYNIILLPPRPRRTLWLIHSKRTVHCAVAQARRRTQGQGSSAPPNVGTRVHDPREDLEQLLVNERVVPRLCRVLAHVRHNESMISTDSEKGRSLPRSALYLSVCGPFVAIELGHRGQLVRHGVTIRKICTGTAKALLAVLMASSSDGVWSGSSVADHITQITSAIRSFLKNQFTAMW